MTENKRFTIEFDGVKYFCVIDVPNERVEGRFDTISDAKGYLELYEYCIELEKENGQLKSRIEHLERKIQRERASAMKQHEKWENEIQKENKELKAQLDSEHQMLDNAILLERTRMGKNSLQQYKEAIQ